MDNAKSLTYTKSNSIVLDTYSLHAYLMHSSIEADNVNGVAGASILISLLILINQLSDASINE
jgi:hypothetical protein